MYPFIFRHPIFSFSQAPLPAPCKWTVETCMRLVRISNIQIRITYCLVPIRCFPSRLPSPACIFFPIHTHSFLATPFHTHTSSRFLHKRTHTHTRIHAYTYELCCFARLWLCRRRTGPSISVQRCVDLQHDQADVGVSGMCGQMSPVTSIQPAAHPIIICNKSSCTHACTQHSI